MTDRRGFLKAMLAACAAPAIVRAGSLMRVNPAIVVPESNLVTWKFLNYDDAVFNLLAARIAVAERQNVDSIAFDMYNSTPATSRLICSTDGFVLG